MMDIDCTPATLAAADRLSGLARSVTEKLAEAGFVETDRFRLNRASLALRRGCASESDYIVLLEVAGIGTGLCDA